MTKKTIAYFLVAFISMIMWNVFLIQRDQKLFDSVYPKQCIKNCEVNHAI